MYAVTVAAPRANPTCALQLHGGSPLPAGPDSDPRVAATMDLGLGLSVMYPTDSGLESQDVYDQFDHSAAEATDSSRGKEKRRQKRKTSRDKAVAIDQRKQRRRDDWHRKKKETTNVVAAMEEDVDNMKRENDAMAKEINDLKQQKAQLQAMLGGGSGVGKVDLFAAGAASLALPQPVGGRGSSPPNSPMSSAFSPGSTVFSPSSQYGGLGTTPMSPLDLLPEITVPDATVPVYVSPSQQQQQQQYSGMMFFDLDVPSVMISTV